LNAVYEGNWENGRMNGQGVVLYKSGVSFKGNWKKGMYHGNGKITYKLGITRAYTGEWHFNKRHGAGTIQLFNDDVFTGYFRNNLMHGNGIYTWKNGVSLKSKWVNGAILPSTESTVLIPEKKNLTNKKSFSGIYQDGRIISPANLFPPILLPSMPITDILP